MQQVSVLSTDGASSYTGKHSGMFQLLRRSQYCSEKLIYLPDVCHRAERLMANNNPPWVDDAIEKAERIISKVNMSSNLRQSLLTYAAKTGM